jgi:hypothetical protein
MIKEERDFFIIICLLLLSWSEKTPDISSQYNYVRTYI